MKGSLAVICTRSLPRISVSMVQPKSLLPSLSYPGLLSPPAPKLTPLSVRIPALHAIQSLIIVSFKVRDAACSLSVAVQGVNFVAWWGAAW